MKVDQSCRICRARQVLDTMRDKYLAQWSALDFAKNKNILDINEVLMLDSEKQVNGIGQLMLVVATMIWGTSFFILKNTLDSLPVMLVLAVRFLVSALILFVMFFNRIKRVKKRTVLVGVALGAILSCAYLLQTYGLTGVSPGENAFLTSTYSVLVPFMCWLLFKKRPDAFSFIAMIFCIVGVGFVALSGEVGFSLGIGQLLTLACAIFYGLQIVVTSFCAEREDRMAVLTIQLFVVGFVCLIGSLFAEVGRTAISLNLELVATLAYLTLACTLLAQGLQIQGLKNVPASQGSLLLSLESVFGVLFSAMLGGENFTVYNVLGFILIFISVIISETKLSFITRLFKKSTSAKDKTDN